MRTCAHFICYYPLIFNNSKITHYYYALHHRVYLPALVLVSKDEGVYELLTNYQHADESDGYWVPEHLKRLDSQSRADCRVFYD